MIKIHEGSTNVYADLGHADADGMLVKAQLATKIAALIKRRHMTQVEAEKVLSMKQPKISAMLRGEFRGISEERMMRCLTALGQNVHIVVKPARGGKAGCCQWLLDQIVAVFSWVRTLMQPAKSLIAFPVPRREEDPAQSLFCAKYGLHAC